MVPEDSYKVVLVLTWLNLNGEFKGITLLKCKFDESVVYHRKPLGTLTDVA